MDNNSTTTMRTSSTDSLRHICNLNYNKCSCQGPTIRVIDSDSGDSGELYHCKCGCDIVASPRQRTRAASPPDNIVTYKAQVGSDKMLVVKQEIEPPIVTTWVISYMAIFMFFLLLAVILIHKASFAVSKADEIMAVLALLLFILIKCRPRYFLPFMLFHVGEDPQRDCIDNEGYQDEQ
ncbi:hypothetical protein BsWGS_01533 [Bradybaena similaris]